MHHSAHTHVLVFSDVCIKVGMLLLDLNIRQRRISAAESVLKELTDMQATLLSIESVLNRRIILLLSSFITSAHIPHLLLSCCVL